MIDISVYWDLLFHCFIAGLVASALLSILFRLQK